MNDTKNHEVKIVHIRPSEANASSTELADLAEAILEGVTNHTELSIRSGIAVRSIPKALRTRYFAAVVRAQVKAKALVALDKAVDDAITSLNDEDERVRSIAREFIRRTSVIEDPQILDDEDKSWDPSQDQVLYERAQKLFGKRLPSGGGET